tara:strand:+ start:198 stop:893 length:696 start_codon:yes stop_codon:yes gene_type:complete
MELLQETPDLSKKTFLGHVFSMTEESNAEVLNVIQYATMGVIPVVALNKIVQKFIPEADTDKSNLEILIEVLIQIIIMFCGIIIIHRIINYFPTYSGFKYENLNLTNVILAFLIIVLSIQTKLGIKVNILVDRLMELWNGPEPQGQEGMKNVRKGNRHQESRADHLDDSAIQQNTFPPAPVATTRQDSGMENYNNMIQGNNARPEMQQSPMMNMGPAAANGVLGGSFGAAF